MSIWAELAEPVAVEPTCEVRYRGASAGAAHRDLAPLPGVSESTARAMLDLAEDALRYDQAPKPRLDCSAQRKGGSRGPVGRNGLMASARGIEDRETAARASWPQIMRGLREMREREPEIARARDLAEAIHYLDYYGRAYPDAETTERVCAPIRLAIVELGGDLQAVEAAIASDKR